MQKSKDVFFNDKFRLLNSQEKTDEISWTSSESSDFERVSNNGNFCKENRTSQNRKRKRKKKVSKNISNLNITIIDPSKGSKEVTSAKKLSESNSKTAIFKRETSPVFAPKKSIFPPKSSCNLSLTSPILSSKNVSNVKSPILTPKYSSPKSSPNVRKKLFLSNNFKSKSSCEVLSTNNSKVTTERDYIAVKVRNQSCSSNLTSKSDDSVRNLIQEKYPKIDKLQDSPKNNVEILESQESRSSKDWEQEMNFGKPKSNVDLAKKIKSYFDSCFSSDSNNQLSQQTVISISDSLTPKVTNSSDDIEISSTLTQMNSRILSQNDKKDFSKTISPASSESAEILEKSKKIRYKKTGLANRLNVLLKKQKTDVSLWQHEKFLAENSNFKIPKGESVPFRIRKVEFKYGCYLLEAVDVDDEEYYILINNSVVNNNNIKKEIILKLYEPFKILDFNYNNSKFKLILNVCKLECIDWD